ncbi:MAG: type I DNA topoisomerase [Candidatus Edwardsbacteria bacterium]
MADNLLIVESPTKAKTISKFLGGNGFQLACSMGHIKDLPEKQLGVDIEKGFVPQYVTIKGKGKVLTQLKSLAKKVKKIYLACDPDREGEAIAWHIANEIKTDTWPPTEASRNRREKSIFRVLFYEITERGIKSAMHNPGKIDLRKVEAQQARRILDRLVGYKVSPFLWKVLHRGLSAGRVQTVALRLICEREEEIANFKPEEYWSITAELQGENKIPFEAELIKIAGKKFKIRNENESKEIIEELTKTDFIVESVETKERKRYPHPPFITSTLQQEASKRLGFSAKKTMQIAQQLYEGLEIGEEGATGLITYMRTDSVRLAPEAISEVRKYIAENTGNDYLPAQPIIYKARKGAQEGHEAIRVTSIKRLPEKIKPYLTADQFRLYELIWKRFLACQMNPAIYEQTTIDIQAQKYLFRATGSALKFPGFLVVGSVTSDEEDKDKKLPKVKEREQLILLTLIPKQHFTEPPPRYMEATLIKELEAKGIGRPSTYAGILSTILNRDYVFPENSRLIPTDLGKTVNKILISRFPRIFEISFTADMETELDKIERGKIEWVQVLRDFYSPFSKDLASAEAEKAELKEKLQTPTNIPCEKCGKPMVIKWGRFGKFLACSEFPQCKNTKPLGEEEIKSYQPPTPCEKCGSPMIVKEGKFGKFLACTNYPKCKNTKPLNLGINCPEDKCSGYLTMRRTKKGRIFYGCSNYPQCKFALWDKPIAEPCPKCGAKFLVEKKSKEKGLYGKCLNCEEEVEL